MKNYHVLSTSAEGNVTELDEQLEQKSPQQQTQKTQKTQETKKPLELEQIIEIHKKLEQEAPIEFEITFEQLLKDNEIDIDVEEIEKKIESISDYFKRGPHKLEHELRTKLSNLFPFHSYYIKVIVQWLIVIYFFAKDKFIKDKFIKIHFKKETFGLDAEFDMNDFKLLCSDTEKKIDLFFSKLKSFKPLCSDTQGEKYQFYIRLKILSLESVIGSKIDDLINDLLEAYENILEDNRKKKIEYTMLYFLTELTGEFFVIDNNYNLLPPKEVAKYDPQKEFGNAERPIIICNVRDCSVRFDTSYITER